MRRLAAPLTLVGARARRRPERWLLPALGLALAVAAGGAVAAEAVIAGDQAARSALAGLSPLARTIRVTWQGPATDAASRQALGLLASVGAGVPTEVVLLNPVRLSGVIVRPVGISPLARWFPGAGGQRLAPCRARGCPMVLAGRSGEPARLSAAGVRITIVRQEPLRSNVPLGFSTAAEGSWPLVVTGDIAGLDRLTGLSGLYRVHSWLAPLSTVALHSWELASVESRLARAQASLLDVSDRFSLITPFGALDAARAAARSAPSRLELVGGSAVVVIALFVLLAASALGPEQRAELDRLELAGATAAQSRAYIAGEAGLLAAAAFAAGWVLAALAAAALAAAGDEPVLAVLRHSVLTPAAAVALAGGWLVAVALLIAAGFARHPRLLDAAAIAGALVLVAALTLGSGGTHAWSAALAPLCCLAAGVIVFRTVGPVLGAAERLARAGPLTLRLAVLGLARNRGLPAFAVAFVAVAVGLGGFALGYRATLARGAADQAAAQVPLDARISPGVDFISPLELAALDRWRSFAGGTVLPVRRTQASYASGTGFATVPAIGLPAAGLALMHGWRRSDSAAPIGALARRLTAPGPVRTPGPRLPAGTRRLTIAVRSPAVGLTVVADLRDAQGDLRRLTLGTAGARARGLTARVPAGSWEVEAIEVDEPTGLAVTDGHQNGENAAAATQSAESVSLGPLTWSGGSEPGRAALTGWRAVGALSPGRSRGAVAATLSFQASGFPGILRPVQPIDRRPVAILADPVTAAAAGPGGRLALTVDGLPVTARVVGVLRRFPTVPPGSGGFVVADQGVLASALDAQLPGQGRADELWIANSRPGLLRAALRRLRFASLSVQFRAGLERVLDDAPVARAVSRTLLVAAALATVLAVAGLLLVVLGPLRDRRIEDDLEAQGIGPRALRSVLLARLAITGVLGVCPGVAIAAALGGLAVSAVAGAGAAGSPSPPLIAIVPWRQLAAWALAVAALLMLAGIVTVRGLAVRGSGAGRRERELDAEPEDVAGVIAR